MRIPVAGLSPWRRAPLLLLRRPGVAVGLAVSALVAVVPAAAAPMFLDAAGTATLHTRAGQACEWSVGSQVSAPLGDDYATETVTRVRQEADTVGRVRGLGPAVTTVSAMLVPTATPSGGHETTNVVARDGAASHIQVLAGTVGSGVWIPDRLAERDSLRPGDRLTFSSTDQVSRPGAGDDGEVTQSELYTPTISLPIVAIYRDLRSSADTSFWCSLASVYRGQPGQSDNASVPDLILTDRVTMLRLATADFLPVTTSVERAYVDAGVDVAQAAGTAAAVAAAQQVVTRTWPSNAGSIGQVHTATLLPGFVGRARLVETNLRGTVLPITIAGSLVGLVVVAAAGVFWARRRRQELVVLRTLGATPAALGFKGLLEAVPALVAGAVGGWWLAWAVVGKVGPIGSALGSSLRTAGLALAAVWVIVWVAATYQCRRVEARPTPARHLRWARWLPWEVAPLGAAAAVWRFGGDQRIARFPDALGAVAQLPVRVLVTPMLVIVGVAVFVVRVYAWSLRRREARPGASVVGHLTMARLRYSVVGGAILMLVTTVPITLAVFGASAVDSVKTTLADQARFSVGADVVITLTRPASVPTSLAGHATAVSRVDGVQIGSITTNLLTIDRSTFADAASWTRIDGQTPADVVRTLRPPAAGGVFPLVAASPVTAGVQQLSSSAVPLGSVDVHPIAALPAEQGGFPTVLADRSILTTMKAGPTSLAATAVDQIWVTGDPTAIRRAAVAAGLPMASFTASNTQFTGTFVEPFTYTFGYLSALALVTGIVATVGFVLYLESRLPSYRRGYVMLRAMTMTRRSHLTLLLGELATPVGVGLAVSAATVAALLAAVHGEFAIDTSRPPGATLAISTAAVAGAAVAAVVVSLTGVLATQRRVTHAKPSEVLRDTE